MKSFFSGNLSQKFYRTLAYILLYELGTIIPLPNIDNEELKNLFQVSQEENFLAKWFQTSLSGGNISFFFLGIGPYINASILYDFLVKIVPYLKELNTENGKKERDTLFFVKILLTVLFSLYQSFSYINVIKPYLYDTSFFSISLNIIELVIGSLIPIWITKAIEKESLISSGASLIILINIILSFFRNQFIFNFSLVSIFCLSILTILIISSQTCNYKIQILSSKQLGFLEKRRFAKKDKSNKFEEQFQSLQNSTNVLILKLNPGGIFPLIIANLFMGWTLNFFTFLGFQGNQPLNALIYSIFIVFTSYLCAVNFIETQKIAEELRKAGVAIGEKVPGKDTEEYLERVVQKIGFRGGCVLATIILMYNSLKAFPNFLLLKQIDIGSYILAITILIDIGKNFKANNIFAFFKKKYAFVLKKE